jgi:pimeloyl-ACP methyl ester carboxylesterase
MDRPRWKQLETQWLPEGAQRRVAWLDDQLKVYYIASSDNRSESTLTPLLFLHGFGGTSWTRGLDAFLRHLPPQQAYYLLDLPGFGKSYPGPVACGVGDPIAWYVDCIVRFLEHERLPVVQIVGHSFGAYLAVHLATRYPQRVTRLVLISPAGLFPVLGRYGWWFGMACKLGGWYVVRRIRAWWVWLFWRWQRLREQVFRWYPRLFYFCSCYSDPKADAGVMFARLMSWTRMGRLYWNRPIAHLILALPCPVQLLYGADDAITPAEQGRWIHAAAPGVQYMEIQSAGHNPLLHPDVPQWLARQIAQPIAQPIASAAVDDAAHLLCRPEAYASSLFPWTTDNVIRLFHADWFAATYSKK